MAKLQIYEPNVYAFYCSGCGYKHYIPVKGARPEYNLQWVFSGTLDNPTLTPSILKRTGSFADPAFVDPPEIPPTICHFFITDGKVIYLSDCTHKLAGQTIDLPDIIHDSILDSI